MSKTKKQSKAVVVIGLMYIDDNVLSRVKAILEKKFGKIKLESDVYNFLYSSYYKNEMGENLKKQIIVFEKMIERDYIVKIKKITDKIENNFLLYNTKRKINIDPGILTLENFILSTNKNFSHRVYLSKSVFAELTLIYKKNEGLTTLPWTYNDFKQKNVIDFLNNVREIFFDKLKESSPFN